MVVKNLMISTCQSYSDLVIQSLTKTALKFLLDNVFWVRWFNNCCSSPIAWIVAVSTTSICIQRSEWIYLLVPASVLIVLSPASIREWVRIFIFETSSSNRSISVSLAISLDWNRFKLIWFVVAVVSVKQFRSVVHLAEWVDKAVKQMC